MAVWPKRWINVTPPPWPPGTDALVSCSFTARYRAPARLEQVPQPLGRGDDDVCQDKARRVHGDGGQRTNDRLRHVHGTIPKAHTSALSLPGIRTMRSNRGCCTRALRADTIATLAHVRGLGGQSFAASAGPRRPGLQPGPFRFGYDGGLVACAEA